MTDKRPRVLLPRLFGVDLDEIDDAVHQRVREPRFDRAFAPRQIGRRACVPAPFTCSANVTMPLGRVRAAVEDDVLDVLEQIRRDVFVDDQLAGVDDAHVEAGLDGVEEKRRVDRLAHDLVAAERERQVADAAADLHAGARLLDAAAPPR